MKTLLLLLLMFLRPGIGEDDAADDDSQTDDQGSTDDGTSSAADDGSDSSDSSAEDTAAELAAERTARATERERADRAEAALRDRQPVTADPQFEEEERILRDPKSTDLQKWQVQSNRALRHGQQTAQTALLEAQNISDRTAFSQLAVTKPDLFKKYETRVETEYAKVRAEALRAGNRVPPRSAILRYMIGDDAMKGDLKAKKPEPAAKPGVVRGKLPGARSDMNGKNSLSDHEKLRKRLDGVNI